jgi:hypothetical protein
MPRVGTIARPGIARPSPQPAVARLLSLANQILTIHAPPLPFRLSLSLHPISSTSYWPLPLPEIPSYSSSSTSWSRPTQRPTQSPHGAITACDPALPREEHEVLLLLPPPPSREIEGELQAGGVHVERSGDGCERHGYPCVPIDQGSRGFCLVDLDLPEAPSTYKWVQRPYPQPRRPWKTPEDLI